MSFAFLPLYTGDYLRDTTHLSPREHGVYLLMLVWCWQHAKPMPNDMLRLCRICACRDATDEAAVKVVLAEFFELEPDGYHNRRIERELTRSNGLVKRGKAGAEARWGKHNGHAKPMLNGCEIDAKSMDPNPNPNPITKIKSKALSGKPDALEVLGYLNRNCGRTYRAVDANLKLIQARLDSGVSVLQMKEVVFAKSKQWASDPKMAEYLRPATLFNATKFEQYLGELHGMPEVQG